MNSTPISNTEMNEMEKKIEPKLFSWNPDTKELDEIITEPSEDSGNLYTLDPVLLMDGHYFDTWGHFILDTVYPFYLLWRDLIEQKLISPGSSILLCRDRNVQITTWNKVVQILNDLFKPKQVIDLKSIKQKIKIRLYRNTVKDFGFFFIDPVCRQIQHNLRDHFKEVGFQNDEILQSKNISDNLKDFVRHVYQTYDLDPEAVNEKVVTLCGRRLNRKMANLEQVKNLLIQSGFKVEVVYFEDLSLKEQVRQMLRSEYLITTYGSNLTNGIFLRPEAKLIILWPKDAKCFWSRKYCILHTAILGRGITIFELDKSEYDQKDRYHHVTQFTGPADYFIRDKNVIKLRKEKKNYQAIMDYPQPAMYDLTNVDFHVELHRLKDLIEKIKDDMYSRFFV